MYAHKCHAMESMLGKYKTEKKPTTSVVFVDISGVLFESLWSCALDLKQKKTKNSINKKSLH